MTPPQLPRDAPISERKMKEEKLETGLCTYLIILNNLVLGSEAIWNLFDDTDLIVIFLSIKLKKEKKLLNWNLLLKYLWTASQTETTTLKATQNQLKTVATLLLWYY